MNFLKRLFSPPKTIITYGPNVSVPQPPAKPESKPKPEPEPAPLPLQPHDEDEITLIDPVAKDVWSIGNPERQKNVPWPKRKPGPKPNPPK